MYIKQYKKVKWYKRLLNNIMGKEEHNIKWIWGKEE